MIFLNLEENDNFHCPTCGGSLLEQLVWLNDQTGYITYYICINCRRIIVDEEYREEVEKLEEIYWQ